MSPASWAAVTYSSTTERMSRGWKACRSSVPSIGILIRRRDHGRDAAPDREVAHDRHAAWRAGGDEIVEDLVGDRLIKDPAVTKLDHVVLQRLQLDAAFVGHVSDANLPEIGEAGLGAHGRKLRTADGDLVVTARLRVGEGLHRHQKSVAFMRVFFGSGFDTPKRCELGYLPEFLILSPQPPHARAAHAGIFEARPSKGNTNGRGPQDGQVRTLLAFRGSVRSEADAGA